MKSFHIDCVINSSSFTATHLKKKSNLHNFQECFGGNNLSMPISMYCIKRPLQHASAVCAAFLIFYFSICQLYFSWPSLWKFPRPSKTLCAILRTAYHHNHNCEWVSFSKRLQCAPNADLLKKLETRQPLEWCKEKDLSVDKKTCCLWEGGLSQYLSFTGLPLVVRCGTFMLWIRTTVLQQ